MPSSIHGSKSDGAKFGEGQGQVAEVALGIDGQDRDAAEQRFLQQHQTQTGLSRPGHADDDAMGGEIGAVQKDGLSRSFTGLWCDAFADEEFSEGSFHPERFARDSSHRTDGAEKKADCGW